MLLFYDIFVDSNRRFLNQPAKQNFSRNFLSIFCVFWRDTFLFVLLLMASFLFTNLRLGLAMLAIFNFHEEVFSIKVICRLLGFTSPTKIKIRTIETLESNGLAYGVAAAVANNPRVLAIIFASNVVRAGYHGECWLSVIVIATYCV